MVAKHNDQYLKNILKLTFFGLIIAHLSLGTFFSSLAVNLAGTFLLIIFIYYNFVAKLEAFGFVILIFVSSMFRFGVSNGGLFNIVAFAITPFFIMSKTRSKLLKNKNNWMSFLLVVFLISNFIGWIDKNEMPTLEMIYGVLSIFGMIFIFIILSKTYFSIDVFRIIINTVIYITIYSFIVNVNQSFNLINVDSPLLWGGDLSSRHHFGTFGDSELFGEFSLLCFVFLLPLNLSSISINKLKLNKKLLLLGTFISFLHIIMSASRSVFLIMIGITALLLLFTLFYNVRVIDRNTKIFPYVISALSLFFVFNLIFELDYVIERFEKLRLGEVNVEKIISGEKINREYAFSFALDRLNSDTWYVGYGWGIRESNQIAWFEDEYIRKVRSDYHSLYLSLPMIYGWFGSAAFLSIFLFVLYKLYKILIKENLKKNYLVLASISMFFLIIAFLINEYKINAMRWPQYFLIIWIWLGIANSIINTYKLNLQRKDIPVVNDASKQHA